MAKDFLAQDLKVYFNFVFSNWKNHTDCEQFSLTETVTVSFKSKVKTICFNCKTKHDADCENTAVFLALL